MANRVPRRGLFVWWVRLPCAAGHCAVGGPMTPLVERAALAADYEVRTAQSHLERALRAIDTLCDGEEALTLSDLETIQNTRHNIQHATAIVRRVTPLIASAHRKEVTR